MYQIYTHIYSQCKKYNDFRENCTGSFHVQFLSKIILSLIVWKQDAYWEGACKKRKFYIFSDELTVEINSCKIAKPKFCVFFPHFFQRISEKIPAIECGSGIFQSIYWIQSMSRFIDFGQEK